MPVKNKSKPWGKARRLPFGGWGGKKKWLLLLFGLVIFLGGGGFLQGRVTHVTDGDTLVVYSREHGFERVRLYGVDCPEKGQAGGEAAKNFSSSLAMFSEVRLKVVNKDRYGRAVCLVTLPDGRILNEALVRAGHAWVYSKFCGPPWEEKWLLLQNKARQEKLGLWHEDNPIRPWVWRK